MKATTVLIFSLLVLSQVTAFDIQRFGDLTVKEFDHPIAQRNWIKGVRASPSQKVTLTFALKQRNLDVLDRIFTEVSDPSHPSYGDYMKLEEITQLIGAEPKNIAMVSQFIRVVAPEAKLSIPATQDFVIAQMTVASAEKLLSTKFYNYRHQTEETKAVRSPGPYYLPSKINQVVDFVGGVTRLPRVKFVAETQVSQNNDAVVPSFIAQSFNIPANLRGTNPKNSQAVAQFLQQYMNFDDLFTFQQQMTLPNQNVSKVVGPNDINNAGTEAELDIQYIMGVAPLVPTWFVSTPGLHEQQEPFLDWIIAMINTPNSPLVHSVSYGDYENSLTLDYMTRVNTQFKIFGAMGKSILFASGDDGVGCNNNCTAFVPNFPASSPYVTAVGGFYSVNSNFTGDSIASGGFSTAFAALSYQKAAVKAYLTQNANNLPTPSFYNVSGRAIPDISSFSENVIVVQDGSQMGVGGTSCASPVIAGVISLLNDARLNANKPSMGFLNPFLYQTFAAHPDAFIDVTTGNNSDGCCSGFNAAAGWDPITGLGAPNFGNLVKYAMAIGQQ